MGQMKNQNKGKKICERAVAFVTVVISREFFSFRKPLSPLSFGDNGNLKRHKQMIHEMKSTKEIECNNCNKKFSCKARTVGIILLFLRHSLVQRAARWRHEYKEK